MKAYHLFLFAVMSACLYSCKVYEGPEQGNLPQMLTQVRFGYIGTNGKLSETSGKDEGTEYFTPFTSQEQMDEAKNKGYGDKVVNNKFQFPADENQDIYFIVRAFPETAGIRDFNAVSSDEDIIEITKIDLKGVHVKIKQLGTANITVFVSGALNTVVADFPIDIIGYCNLAFYLRDFQLRWDGILAGMSSNKELEQMNSDEKQSFFEKLVVNSFRSVSVKNKMKALPKGIDDVFIQIKDSITVTDYIDYYRLENGTMTRHIQRNRYPFRRNSRYYSHIRNRRITLRNITSVVQHIYNKTVKGDRIETKEIENEQTGKKQTVRDTIPYDYRYIVEHVRLDYWVYCDNPYIYFDTKVETYGTVNTTEDMGDVGPDDDSDLENLKEGTSNLFEVILNDFMTQAQRDSVLQEMREQKKKAGYLDTYTQEQKDSVVAKMNEHLDNPVEIDWTEEPV